MLCGSRLMISRSSAPPMVASRTQWVSLSSSFGSIRIPTTASSAVPLWTLYPTRRLLSARVSAFLDCLKSAFPNGTPDELAAYIGE
ncbi:hypothetical protein PHZ_p0279 (plasmid) [Phenylobacterium zucineum HLK1]|uniref:Uncharacterized protein n=1 Tax=Phenylobacterium zucineum (strain HLK1) TaxID=450851 RepID=B4RIP7_PHEZH|nr:hypothetical protein PHZ_p0279 [Phenylobacterium zucineum HLK1]